MNKQEAEQKVKEWKEKREKVFCPMINGICRLDCQCLYEMVINDDLGENNLYTSGGYCTCYILNGNY